MKKILSVLIVLVLVLALFACAKTDAPPAADLATSQSPSAGGEPSAPPVQPGDDAKYGGVLRLVCTAEGANPIGVPWEVFGVDTALLIPACETLVFQKTNGDIVPHLVSDYTVDMEKNEIRMSLRQGVKFSDGSDWNADVAVWNLEWQQEAKTLSTAVTSMEARGEHEIALLFDVYSSDILAGLASRGNAVISKESYEKNGLEWARDNPVGTGPFVLKEYVHGSSVSYVKNPDYWQEGKPYLDGMEFHFIRDVMTQNVALQAEGDQSIDVLNTTNAEQASTLREMGFNVYLMSIGPISLVPSSLDPNSPFHKMEVRQAISYAIDRESIVAARGFGILTPAYQFIGEAWPGHLPDSYNSSYDLDKAKELMAQAGYADGFKTTLYAQPALADKDAAVAIQSMLAQINIEASVEFPDAGGYSAYRSNGWDGMLVQHTRSLPLIVSTFNFYFGTTTKLLSQLWYPSDMEADIIAARQAVDGKEELEKLSKIVADNMLLMPVYNLVDSWVTKPNVQGGEFTEWGSSTMFLAHETYFAN